MSLQDLKKSSGSSEVFIGDDLASPLQSSVFNEFNSNKFHVAYLTARQLIAILSEHFGLSLTSNISTILQRSGVDLTSIQIDELVGLLPTNLAFERGLMRGPSQENSIKIDHVIIGLRSMNVSVSGTSKDAELVLGTILNSVNEAAGFGIKFNTDAVFAKSYKTSTYETMNFGIDAVFSEQFKMFLNETIRSSVGDYKKIGTYPIKKASSLAEGVHLTCRFEELQLVITRMDLVSGHSEPCILRISPRGKSDVNLGEYYVASEYDFETHSKLVKVLREKFSN